MPGTTLSTRSNWGSNERRTWSCSISLHAKAASSSQATRTSPPSSRNDQRPSLQSSCFAFAADDARRSKPLYCSPTSMRSPRTSKRAPSSFSRTNESECGSYLSADSTLASSSGFEGDLTRPATLSVPVAGTSRAADPRSTTSRRSRSRPRTPSFRRACGRCSSHARTAEDAPARCCCMQGNVLQVAHG